MDDGDEEVKYAEMKWFEKSPSDYDDYALKKPNSKSKNTKIKYPKGDKNRYAKGL